MSISIPTIGRLQSVDVREVWASEPYNFTPWLAEPANLQFLADSLDLPGLELIRTEHPVDSFSADIVCRVVDTEHHVLIENQLERTDHLHLGQVLTYAPRFDARIVVWIAREFTDAHRAALDWLNRITGEDYAFFGAEIRAVRIGSSAPAPLFDVVVKPNDWTKATMPGGSGTPADSAYNLSNLAFWKPFQEALEEAGGPIRQATRPLKDSNYWAPLTENGRCYISAWRSQNRNPHVGVFLGFYNAGAEQVFDELLVNRAAFEARYGETLTWSANKQRTVFKIFPPPFYSSLDVNEWPSQRAWLVQQMVHLRDIFGSATVGALQRHAPTEIGSTGK